MLRKHGSQTIDGRDMCISGTGSWKTLTVNDTKTGEVIVEKKFYKTDFDQVISSPEYAPYVNALLESSMIRKMEDPEAMTIDPESYEEVRSVALDLEDDFVSPEE